MAEDLKQIKDALEEIDNHLWQQEYKKEIRDKINAVILSLESLIDEAEENEAVEWQIRGKLHVGSSMERWDVWRPCSKEYYEQHKGEAGENREFRTLYVNPLLPTDPSISIAKFREYVRAGKMPPPLSPELEAVAQGIQRAITPPEATSMEQTIRCMVDSFMAWKLPEDFSPDAGISFNREYAGKWGMPTGTNLFNGTQAQDLIKHLISSVRMSNETFSASGKSGEHG